MTALGCVALIAACTDDRASVAVQAAHVRGDSLALQLDICLGRDRRVDVQETGNTVVVHVVAQRQRGSGEDCADLVTVELQRPLGSRRLVDGTTNKAVPVR